MSPFRVLFVNKQRHTYWGCAERHSGAVSSGLGNSVRFIADMLNMSGVAAKAVEVADNNAIEREIVLFRPSHVIIEALWVVPDKFHLLRRLYPRIQWIVRLHSNLPFLANEGIAAQWLAGYLARDVEVMCNAWSAVAGIRQIAIDYGRPEALVTYGPNYYPVGAMPRVREPRRGVAHVGCFGALRPLKNQLAQAVAAVSFANQAELQLHFHVNAGRIEGGSSVWRNLQALFASSVGGRHRLVAEPWLPWGEFRDLLGTSIDVSMQVSFSETFNIVAADSVAMGVPTVVSPEISWLGSYARVEPTDVRGMAAALLAAYPATPTRIGEQIAELAAWSAEAKALWLERFA